MLRAGFAAVCQSQSLRGLREACTRQCNGCGYRIRCQRQQWADWFDGSREAAVAPQQACLYLQVCRAQEERHSCTLQAQSQNVINRAMPRGSFKCCRFSGQRCRLCASSSAQASQPASRRRPAGRARGLFRGLFQGCSWRAGGRRRARRTAGCQLRHGPRPHSGAAPAPRCRRPACVWVLVCLHGPGFRNTTGVCGERRCRCVPAPLRVKPCELAGRRTSVSPLNPVVRKWCAHAPGGW